MQTKKNPISNPCLKLPEECKTGRTFKRREHLKRREEITRVFKKGRSVSCIGIRLYFLANGLPNNRIAVTFVRKYGNAVRRNRARRLSREAYRLMKNDLMTGFDLVLLMYPQKPETGQGSLSESSGQLITLFEKAGICCQRKKCCKN
ncbi:MAG: ribonuclease P protein component [Treponema sp.]|nr:ribonuclease P protein component [Treponema sp.]